MDLKMLSLGERIVAASGAALFVLLFLGWLQGENAWQLFSIVDVLMAILALTAVGLPLAKAAGVEPTLAAPSRTILVRVATVAVVFVLAYFLEAVNQAQIGLWLSVLAAVVLLYGASTIPGEQAPVRRRDRSRPSRTASDFEEPPPGMESWREGGLYGDAEREGTGATGAARAEPEAAGEDRPRRPRSPTTPEPPQRTEVRGTSGSTEAPPPDER